MTGIANKVLDRMRRDEVRPLPSWRFTLHSVVTWIGFAVFALLGAHAVSVVLFLLSEHDWTELANFRGGPVWYALHAVPTVWLLLLVALLAGAYLDFRHTREGYRYRSFAVIGGLVAFSLLAGGTLHAVGVGRLTDRGLARRVPQYRQVAPRGLEIWDRPEEGRLVGMYVGEEDGRLVVRGPDGREWLVELRDGMQVESLEPGMMLRVIGYPSDVGTVSAVQVMPFRPGLMRGGRPKPDGCAREEFSCPWRSNGERSMRPPVHPVARD